MLHRLPLDREPGRRGRLPLSLEGKYLHLGGEGATGALKSDAQADSLTSAMAGPRDEGLLWDPTDAPGNDPRPSPE